MFKRYFIGYGGACSDIAPSRTGGLLFTRRVNIYIKSTFVFVSVVEGTDERFRDYARPSVSSSVILLSPPLESRLAIVSVSARGKIFRRYRDKISVSRDRHSDGRHTRIPSRGSGAPESRFPSMSVRRLKCRHEVKVCFNKAVLTVVLHT